MQFTLHHFKVMLFCIGLLLTSWRSWNCIEKYLEFSKSTRLKMVSSQDTLKPALTLCPSYSYAYNERNLNNFGISSRKDYRYGNWRGNSSLDPKEIFLNVTYNIEDFIDLIAFRFFSGRKIKFTNSSFSSLRVLQIFHKEMLWN